MAALTTTPGPPPPSLREYTQLTQDINPMFFSLFQRGDRLQTPESDVSRRQILTSKFDPHPERVKY